jgi:integrase
MERRAHGEGTIRHRTDGRWEGMVRVELDSGAHKRVAVYGKTKGEVSRKLVEFRQRKTKTVKTLGKSQNLADYLESWHGSMSGDGTPWKQTTYQAREINARRITNVIGSVPIDKVSVSHIKLLDRTLHDQGLSSASRRQALAILQAAFGAALFEGTIDVNPFTRWRRQDAPKADKRPVRTLNKLQRQKLLALQDEWTPVWKIQLATGMRIGETLALKWESIVLPNTDGENGVLHVRWSIHRSTTEPDGYYLDTPKTKNSARTFALHHSIVKLFKDIKAARKEEKQRIKDAGGVYVDKGFVFTRESQVERIGDGKVGGIETGGKPLLAQNAWDALQRSLKKAGVEKFSVHELRHTMITEQLLRGVDIAKVSKVVGHSSVAFTIDVYSHITDQMELEVAEAAALMVEESSTLSPEMESALAKALEVNHA